MCVIPTWLLVTLIVTALIAGFLLGRLTSGSGTGIPASGRSGAASPTRTTDTSTTVTTLAAVTGTTLPPIVTTPGQTLSASGTGTSTSQSFSFIGAWHLAWSFTCPQGPGHFHAAVLSPTGPVGADPPIDASGASGTGTQSYTTGGTLVLQITTKCAWTVKFSA
jgi:hypothetical protein